MNFRIALLVGLSLFAVVSVSTLVPLASADCVAGGVYPACATSRPRCDVIVMPRCDPLP